MHVWGNESDDQLLAAAAGDEAAFTALYQRWERPILVYFRRRTGDSELAADLTAEVFAAALRSCGRWHPGGAPAAAWLFTIAHRTLSKSRRRGAVEDRARRRLAMAPIELEDADIRQIDELGDESLLNLLEALPAEQREAIRARVLDEQSYDEIAGRMRCSSAVVRKRVSRGLGRMRDQIGEETR
jgi:RNA polymerase sigma-70 factor, ECF subfamily